MLSLVAPALFKICSRPLVNSTVPKRTHAAIHSPGWPSGYLGPHDCTLTVVLPNISWIGFYTVNFSLLQPPNGCEDSLTIKNKARPEDGTVHCGKITPKTLLFHDSAFDPTDTMIDVHFQAKSFIERDSLPEQNFVVDYIGKN